MKKLALFAMCAFVVFLAACGGNSAKPGNGRQHRPVATNTVTTTVR